MQARLNFFSMSATDSIFVLMFSSGLLGGFGHCIGMCGPVVAVYSLNLKGRSIAPHLLFNLGRITTYGMLGALAGLTGSFIGVMEPLERFQHIVLFIVGAAMVVAGLAVAGWLNFLFPLSALLRFSGYFISHLNRIVRFIGSAGSKSACFPMGLVLGFMPCGLLYTALIAAAGAGMAAGDQVKGLLSGMLLLLLFGIGTFPAMLLVGQVVTIKGEWLRSRLYKGSAIAMIAAGFILLYRALK